MNMYVPIIIVILSNTFYHICTKGYLSYWCCGIGNSLLFNGKESKSTDRIRQAPLE